jgi:hypothetical protein
MTNGILRFNTNSPVEVALRYDDGKRVEGRYGEKVMFTLEGDQVMYVPPVVAKQIRELGIRAREIFEICKAELREENKRWIEWRVRRLEEPRHPASSPNVSDAAATVQSGQAQNHRNGSTHQIPRALDLAGLSRRDLASGAGNRGRDHGHGVSHERSGGDRATRRVPSPHSELFAPIHQRRYPGHWADHVHPGHAGARCDMGSALTADLVPAHLVQLSFPTTQDLPVLAPIQESPSTELIVAPEVALTKYSGTDGTVAGKTDPAPVLSPSQVRCFFDCQARWWFKYGLQLPERKNSSLALGLAVHQALEVNFREKIETREDLETTGVVCVFREAWMEQVPETVFTPTRARETCAGWVKGWLPSTWTRSRPRSNRPRSNSMYRAKSPASRYEAVWTCWMWKGG